MVAKIYYRLLENFTAKWNGNGNGNAYDRGDYNSSFALRAVELISCVKREPFFRVDTNRAEQQQKLASGLKFQIKEEEGLLYLCCENKAADQLYS